MSRAAGKLREPEICSQEDKFLMLDALSQLRQLKKFSLCHTLSDKGGQDYLHASYKKKGTVEMYLDYWSDLGSANLVYCIVCWQSGLEDSHDIELIYDKETDSFEDTSELETALKDTYLLS